MKNLISSDPVDTLVATEALSPKKTWFLMYEFTFLFLVISY